MIGVPRSGTSILSEAFAMNEDLGWLPSYLNIFPRAYWPCIFNRLTSIPRIGIHFRGKKYQNKKRDSKIKRYFPYSAEVFPFWESLLGNKFSWDYLISQKSSRKERKSLHAAVEKILKYQGKNRLFAKYTGPSKICFLNSIFPDACYVHVIRDPKAVVSSLMQVDFWRKKGGLFLPWWRNGLTSDDLLEWENCNKSPIALAAIQWKRIIEVTHSEKSYLQSTQFYEAKYEDFVINPHKTLSMSFSFFGLNESDQAHQYISSIGKIHNSNYKYKLLLNSSDIKLIDRITAPIASRYGYT